MASLTLTTLHFTSSERLQCGAPRPKIADGFGRRSPRRSEVLAHDSEQMSVGLCYDSFKFQLACLVEAGSHTFCPNYLGHP